MERKRGEIFEYNGEWYQCVKGRSCNCCDLLENGICVSDFSLTGNCFSYPRKDKTNVLFKKLKKVGEPYLAHDHSRNKDVIVQDYKLYNQSACYNGHEEMLSFGLCGRNEIVTIKSKESIKSLNCENSVEIQIKQNKENMEENEENKYDGKMDKECIPLCDALNSLPDVETTESCCGHCKDRFRIFFKCKNPYSLSVIARVFNRRYSGTKLQWIIEVETHDNGGYNYFVHSVEAYENNTMMEKDISQLVENIKYWSSEKYKEHFINGVKSEEKKKLNLKPFNFEQAKAGKPVCTRDGRKTRIIAFDRRLFYKNVSYPILALVERSEWEDDVCGYNEKGKVLIEDGAEYKDDLMMLPEKKEGWINIYKGGKLDADYIYLTRTNALENIFHPMKDNYIDTIKVKWEE